MPQKTDSLTRSLSVAMCLLAGWFHPGPQSAAPCSQDSDCHKDNPDDCNICPANQMSLACESGACVCACEAQPPDATVPECSQNSDCHKYNPDECNSCAGDMSLVCWSGTCRCACDVPDGGA